MPARPQPAPHIFGIRHHGPGSARSLRHALAALRPDTLLVEGPPDADALIPLVAHATMQPPVALLIYLPDHPHHAVYYPFAVFSPEWQAILYALENNIPVRFMDLPQAHQLQPIASPAVPGTPDAPILAPDTTPTPDAPPDPTPVHDPIGWLAAAAGYPDGERWWEHMIEQRRASTGVFEALLEAMTALRAAIASPAVSGTPVTPDSPDTLREAQREAFMRQTIRAAQKSGAARIAVVCGAWHAPALAQMPAASVDAALLKGLPRHKTQATWIPWTHARLALASGYGAGIHSPGWYHHLWTAPDHIAIRWMTHVAQLLRSKDLDASPGHIIEAVRLAETLAALRERPLPGLPELLEAAQAVLCFGQDAPLRLIHTHLIVGQQLGAVPPEAPRVPLQADLEAQQKRLKLRPSTEKEQLPLDLRQPTHIEKSLLLHRLRLLDIAWSQGAPTTKRSSHGTFNEIWTLQWHPELALAVINAAIWGVSVLTAATARTRAQTASTSDLPALSALMRQMLAADLPDALPDLLARLQAAAALTRDVTQMLDALPDLITASHHPGVVRRADPEQLRIVIAELVTRACIGLPGACSALNEDAARALDKSIMAAHQAIDTLNDPEHRATWRATLTHVLDLTTLPGLLAGRIARLLRDDKLLAAETLARHLSFALSPGGAPDYAAAWIEGFFAHNAGLLLHTDDFWPLLDAWLVALPEDTFITVLPLLRRTFSTFDASARNALSTRARTGRMRAHTATTGPFDQARAEAALPLMADLLGLTRR